jgi:hypothetical protein
MTMLSNCPICSKDDKVEKVSAIVASQTHRVAGGSHESQVYVDKDGKTKERSVYVPYSGTQTSALAQKLALPTPPFPWLDAFYSIAKLIARLLVPFGKLVLVICVGGIVVIILSNLKILQPQLGLDLIPTVLFFAVFYGIAPIVIGKYAKNWLTRKQKTHEEQQRLIAARWQAASDRWKRLYYCYRDDVVFLPDENTSTPSSQVQSYIFR